MQVEGICNLNTLDAAVVNYINDLKTQITKFKNESIENYKKYLFFKERYELLTYRRFMRSAEQIPYDNKQQFLFSGEAEPEELPAEEEKEEEKTEVKAYTRSKRGRKPIDPKFPRDVIEIDIPESERTCACGAQLTRIGEEVNEKLEFTPASIRVIQTVRPKYAEL